MVRVNLSETGHSPFARAAVLLALCVAGASGAGTARAAGPARGWYAFSEKYTRWQADRPLLIGAMHNSVPEDHLAERAQRFRAAGLNTLVWWKPGNALSMFRAASEAGLGWACGSVGGIKQISAARKIPGNAFIMIGDEPGEKELPAYAKLGAQVRRRYPNVPAFTNIAAMKLDHDRFIKTCQPDVFCFDQYPLLRNGQTQDSYLYNLAWMRHTARKHRLPLWMFLQAFGRKEKKPSSAYRLPDEADMRFLVFTLLAHGGTGMVFFHYYGWPESMVIDPGVRNPGRTPAVKHRYENTLPSRSWYAVRDVAPEAHILARALLRLRSKREITYVGNGLLWDRPSPNYSKHNRTDGYRSQPFKGYKSLRSVRVLEKDNMGALVALFCDKAGQEYFMVVNMQHGAGMSKADGGRTVRLAFSRQIKKVERLSRLTGRVEVLNTGSPPPATRVNPRTGRTEVATERGNVLDVRLEGGTGDLFKWHTGQPWDLRPAR